jgi:hypothetical protein
MIVYTFYNVLAQCQEQCKILMGCMFSEVYIFLEFTFDLPNPCYKN